MTPWGVGSVPSAHSRSPRCGVMVTDPNPGEAGARPRTCSVIQAVGPAAQPWQRLWEMLPDKQRSGGGWSPPLPLILAAWHDATDSEKTERFRLHLAWAAQHAALDEAIAFLRSLAPSDWYTQS